MINREKVIKGLECCGGTGMCFHGCPYHEVSQSVEGCTSQLAADALELLKEQQETISSLQGTICKLNAALEEQEVRELTIEEWQEWKANKKRNPICILWENDTSPIWVFKPTDVHEPALLMGKLKLFTGKPSFEQCKAVKWNER